MAITPAAAQDIGQGGGFVFGDNGSANTTVELFRATCVNDSANATTYNGAGFQAITITGLSDTDTALIVVGVGGEDGTTVFSVNSMTIEGIAATEIVDEDGSGVTNTAIYRLPYTISGAASVNVSVTFSEAITNAQVCVWALKNLKSLTPTSSAANNHSTGGAVALTLNPTTSGGFAVGICSTRGDPATHTWAVLTERDDNTAAGESSWTNADAATTGASMAVTCDQSGSDNTSGSAAAFR